MAAVRHLFGLMALGVTVATTGPAGAQDLVSAINSYLESTNEPGPTADVTGVVSLYVAIGQREVDATSSLLSDGFKLVRHESTRYFWNLSDVSGSQYYIGFEQTRNKQIVTTLTYTIELGIRDGAVCWEHAVVIGGSI